MLQEAIDSFLQRHHLTGISSLVVAVSGGIDSTALLVALHELQRFTLVAAHVNHHLRGADSDADEAFVRDLCARLGVTLHVADGTLDPDAVRDRGTEAAAREVRFTRLREIADRVPTRWIATAHQQNDQAETIVMRLMTGGGLAALRGIHPLRDDGVIRPLLEVRRDDIDGFLRARDLVPRVDRSNSDPRFLRNRVRALLATFGDAAVSHLAATAAQANQQWTALQQLVDKADIHVTAKPAQSHFHRLPEDAWLRQALLHRHIRRLDPSSRDVSSHDLVRLAAELDLVTRVSVTKSLELVRDEFELVLRRKSDEVEVVDPFELELAAGESVYIPEVRGTVGVAPAGRHRGARHAARRVTQRFQLPAGAEPRFIVRNRRAGDRVQPLGMTTDKKLKDFLIDRKIAAELRDRIPLLLWNDAIVWVAGVEIAERFKVADPANVTYEVWLERDDHDDLHG